jgi:hypothetical protein
MLLDDLEALTWLCSQPEGRVAVNAATPVRLAAFVVALALACVSAAFSIDHLTAIFAGAFWPIIIMRAVLEAGKQVAVAWLTKIGPRLRLILVLMIGVLMGLNAIGRLLVSDFIELAFRRPRDRICDPAVDVGFMPAGPVDADLDWGREGTLGDLAVDRGPGQPGPSEDGLQADDTVWFAHGRAASCWLPLTASETRQDRGLPSARGFSDPS